MGLQFWGQNGKSRLESTEAVSRDQAHAQGVRVHQNLTSGSSWGSPPRSTAPLPYCCSASARPAEEASGPRDMVLGLGASAPKSQPWSARCTGCWAGCSAASADTCSGVLPASAVEDPAAPRGPDPDPCAVLSPEGGGDPDSGTVEGRLTRARGPPGGLGGEKSSRSADTKGEGRLSWDCICRLHRSRMGPRCRGLGLRLPGLLGS